MEVNRKVYINNTTYDDLPENIIGTIERINPTWLRTYQVRVEDFINARGSTDCYYFTDEDLQIMDIPSAYPSTLFQYSYDKFIKKENKIMKNKQLIKGYRKVVVRFSKVVDDNGIMVPNEHADGYLHALYDNDIDIGDYVLCVSKDGHTIGYVEKIWHDDDAEISNGREIICKIDYSKYIERQERLKKVEKLKSAMQKKKEELNELAIYQALAATSPEMAEMLKELKELL